MTDLQTKKQDLLDIVLFATIDDSVHILDTDLFERVLDAIESSNYGYINVYLYAFKYSRITIPRIIETILLETTTPEKYIDLKTAKPIHDESPFQNALTKWVDSTKRDNLFKLGIDKSSMSGAATAGNVGLMQYIYDLPEKTRDQELTFHVGICAAHANQLDALEWYVERNGKMHPLMGAYAALNNNVEMLKYIHMNGGVFDKWTYLNSLRTGHDACLEYVKSHNLI